MIVINPLLPFFPESLSFLIYGIVTGLLLKFWRIAKRNIFIILFFLYAYAVWLASMALLMSVQSQTRQAWFIFGFILTFLNIFSIIRTITFTPFTWAFETITDRVQERRADQRDRERQQQRDQENQNYHDRDQDIRAEQARREAEARANRARQTGSGKDNRQDDSEKIEDKKSQLIKSVELLHKALSVLNSDGDINEFGHLLDEAWKLKKSISPVISNSIIDRAYEKAISSGATGGKITGAGGGGFLLLFAPPETHDRIRNELNELIYVPFNFETSGSQIIFYDPEKEYHSDKRVLANSKIVSFDDASPII